MSLTWPTSDSLEDEWKRRGKAIEAGIRYCGFLEGSPLRGRPQNDFLSTRPRLSDVQQTPLKKNKRTNVELAAYHDDLENENKLWNSWEIR